MTGFARTALLVVAALAACVAAVPPVADPPSPRSLTLASTQWPPFTAEPGDPRVASELVDQALRADAIAAEQAIVPTEDWLESIRSGRFDGSAAAWWSEDRTDELLYSAPYLENRLVLVGLAGADVSATSFAQLSGKRVCTIETYAYGDALTPGPDAGGPEFVARPDPQTCVRALLAGEVDYALADALVVHYALATHPRRDEFVAGDATLVTRTLHFVVRKDLPDAQAIIDDFDARVRQMLRDGSYNRVLGLDWIEADVDGDGEPELIFAGEQAGTAPPSGSYRVHEREQERPQAEVQPDYIINGQTYENWDAVPDSFKVTGAGGLNVGVAIHW